MPDAAADLQGRDLHARGQDGPGNADRATGAVVTVGAAALVVAAAVVAAVLVLTAHAAVLGQDQVQARRGRSRRSGREGKEQRESAEKKTGTHDWGRMELEGRPVKPRADMLWA